METAAPFDTIVDPAGSQTELRTISGVFTKVGPDVAHINTVTGETLLMPATEWTSQRRWARGQRVLALRVQIGGTPIASVTRPELVAALAEGVVPEIRDGRVRIMGIARVPGVRTKIAVAATVPDVDAVASCVGRGAARVRMLSSQLAGERVDVIAWDPDRLRYLISALAPARVSSAVPSEDNADMAIVTAPRHQMAAAVGEGGLNSQLAGQLTGFDVTIVPE